MISSHFRRSKFLLLYHTNISNRCFFILISLFHRNKHMKQIMYDDISENDLSYEEKTTNADGTPAAYLPKFGGGNRYRLVKLELLSRYYSDVLTIAHDYIITADYKLLPATEAIGEDYESGYIAYPPDVMEKLLALDGY